MSRTSWIRLGSLAAIIGGIGPLLIYTLYAPFFLILLHIPLPMSSLLHQISTGLPHRLLSVLVVQWILYVPALIGLQARSAQRTGIAGWVGVTIALLGALIGALGYTLYWIGRGVEASVNPIVSGSVLLAIGMILYGVAALRGPALPRLNWLPLAIGVTKLLIPADPFFVAYLFGQDSPLIQLVQNIMGYGFVGTILTVASGLAPAIGWLLLGIALWPRREEVTVTQDVSLPVEPAV